MNRRELIRTGISGLGFATLIGYSVYKNLTESGEETRRAEEYQQHINDIPRPTETPEMNLFAEEMTAVFPNQVFTIENIRMGKYDKSSKTFQIDGPHLIFNTDISASHTRQLLELLDGVYGFVTRDNLQRNINDRIGISEQARRVTMDPTWSHDRPLTTPDRNPHQLIGLGIRGTLDERTLEQTIFLLVGGKDHIELHDASPRENLGFWMSTSEGNYRSPFVFDASARMGPPLQLPE